jgi:hypothetical protein
MQADHGPDNNKTLQELTELWESRTSDSMTFQFGFQVAFWTQMEGLLFSPNDLKFCEVFSHQFLKCSLHLTLNWHLTKTVPIQKLDQFPQMHPKIMDLIRILKIWLSRVVQDFKWIFQLTKHGIWFKNEKLAPLKAYSL